MNVSWVQTLSWEDALEEEMATHSSILAWKIPRTEEPGGLHRTQLSTAQQLLSHLSKLDYPCSTPQPLLCSPAHLDYSLFP